jgi:hypothetical protein
VGPLLVRGFAARACVEPSEGGGDAAQDRERNGRARHVGRGDEARDLQCWKFEVTQQHDLVLELDAALLADAPARLRHERETVGG